MDKPFTGSPIMHPKSKCIGHWNGTLDAQDHLFQTGIGMIRTGFIPSMTSLPDYIEIILKGGEIVRGVMMLESLSRNSRNDSVRFILNEWEGSILRFSIITIDMYNRIRAEVRENPPDLHHTSSKQILV